MSIFKEFIVKSNIRDYCVYFCDDFALELGPDEQDDNFFIIDQNVASLYGNQLSDILGKENHILVEAVENNKNIEMVTSIIESLLQRNFKRNGRLIAIGGGIIQDLTGFVSSILFRGVEWVFYPTTLLAQGDSCIGSKTSINVGQFKNQLGNFYPPSRIIIDSAFLDTLTPAAIRSGIGEMIKVHLLDSTESFQFLKDRLPLAKQDRVYMDELIFHSLQIKKRVIEIDEFDTDYRNIMNYGHTFGHAIESVSDYKLMHGEAVIIGMDISNYISLKKGLITQTWFDEVRALLFDNWPEYGLQNMDLTGFLAALRRDKKNVGQSLTMILTKGPGTMFKEKSLIDNDFKDLIESYFSDLTTEGVWK